MTTSKPCGREPDELVDLDLESVARIGRRPSQVGADPVEKARTGFGRRLDEPPHRRCPARTKRSELSTGFDATRAILRHIEAS
jgi:hypothetical protein